MKHILINAKNINKHKQIRRGLKREIIDRELIMFYFLCVRGRFKFNIVRQKYQNVDIIMSKIDSPITELNNKREQKSRSGLADLQVSTSKNRTCDKNRQRNIS